MIGINEELKNQLNTNKNVQQDKDEQIIYNEEQLEANAKNYYDDDNNFEVGRQQKTKEEKLYGKRADIANVMPKNIGSRSIKKGSEKEEFSLLGAGMSMTFIASLDQILTDTGKASTKYFQPVVYAVNKLLDSTSDDTCASRLGILLEACTYYLKKRGSSWFSSQRNNRRSVCKNIIKEIGKFLYDAPEVYARKIKDTIVSYQDENKVLPSNWNIIAQAYRTSILPADLEAGAARDALFAQEHYDSLYIQNERIDAVMKGQRLPVPPAADAPAEEKKNYEKSIKEFGLLAIMEYEKAIDECERLKNTDENMRNRSRADALKKWYRRQRNTVEHVIGRAMVIGQLSDCVTWYEAVRDTYRETGGKSIAERAESKALLRSFLVESYFGVNDMPGDADKIMDDPSTEDVMKYTMTKALGQVSGKNARPNDDEIDAMPVAIKKKIAEVSADTVRLLLRGVLNGIPANQGEPSELDEAVSSYANLQERVIASLAETERLKNSNDSADRRRAITLESDEYRALEYRVDTLGEQSDTILTRMDDISSHWTDVRPTHQRMLQNFAPDFIKIKSATANSIFDVSSREFNCRKYREADELCDQITDFAREVHLELPENEQTDINNFKNFYGKYQNYLNSVDLLVRHPGYNKLRAAGYGLKRGGIIPVVSKRRLTEYKDSLEQAGGDAEVIEAIDKMLLLMGEWVNKCSSEDGFLAAYTERLYRPDENALDERRVEASTDKLELIKEMIERSVSTDAIIVTDRVLKDRMLSIVAYKYAIEHMPIEQCKALYTGLALSQKVTLGEKLSEEESASLDGALTQIVDTVSLIGRDALSFDEKGSFIQRLDKNQAILSMASSAVGFLNIYSQLHGKAGEFSINTGKVGAYTYTSFTAVRAFCEGADPIRTQVYDPVCAAILEEPIEDNVYVDNMSFDSKDMIDQKEDELTAVDRRTVDLARFRTDLSDMLKMRRKKDREQRDEQTQKKREETEALKAKKERRRIEAERLQKEHEKDIADAKASYCKNFDETINKDVLKRFADIKKINDKSLKDAGIMGDDAKLFAINRNVMVTTYFTENTLREGELSYDELNAEMRDNSILLAKDVGELTPQEKTDMARVIERFFKAVLSFDLSNISIDDYTSWKDVDREKFGAFYTAVWACGESKVLFEKYEKLMAEAQKDRGDEDGFNLIEDEKLTLALSKEDVAEVREKTNVISSVMAYVRLMDSVYKNNDIKEPNEYLEDPDLQQLDAEVKQLQKKKSPQYKAKADLLSNAMEIKRLKIEGEYSPIPEADMNVVYETKRKERKLAEVNPKDAILLKLSDNDFDSLKERIKRSDEDYTNSFEKKREILEKEKRKAKKQEKLKKREATHREIESSKDKDRVEDAKTMARRVDRSLRHDAFERPFSPVRKFAPMIDAQSNQNDQVMATWCGVTKVGISEQESRGMFEILSFNGRDFWKDVKREDMSIRHTTRIHALETLFLGVLEYDLDTFDPDTCLELMRDNNLIDIHTMSWLGSECAAYIDEYEGILDRAGELGYDFPITKEDLKEIRFRMSFMREYVNIFNALRNYYEPNNLDTYMEKTFDELIKEDNDTINAGAEYGDKDYARACLRIKNLREKTPTFPWNPGQSFEGYMKSKRDEFSLKGADRSEEISKKLRKRWVKDSKMLLEKGVGSDQPVQMDVNIINEEPKEIPDIKNSVKNRAAGKEEIEKEYADNKPIAKVRDVLTARNNRLRDFRRYLEEEKAKPIEKQRASRIKELTEKISAFEAKIEFIKKYNETKQVQEIMVGDELFKTGGMYRELDPKIDDMELFPSEDLTEGLKQSLNTCYIIAALYGIIKTGGSDYIRNTLIKEYGDDKTKAVVRLYDEDGIPLDIVVSRAGFRGDDRPLWVQLVEKAASVVLNKTNYGNGNAKHNPGAGFAADVPWDKWEGYCKKGGLVLSDVVDGSEETGFRMLTGKLPLGFTTRSLDFTYKNGYSMYDYCNEGDIAIGKMQALLDKGKIVLASTCHNMTEEQRMILRREDPGCAKYENNYHTVADAVVFDKNFSIYEKHVVMIESVYEEYGVITVFDPLRGRTANLKFDEFRKHFTDVKAMDKLV